MAEFEELIIPIALLLLVGMTMGGGSSSSDDEESFPGYDVTEYQLKPIDTDVSLEEAAERLQRDVQDLIQRANDVFQRVRNADGRLKQKPSRKRASELHAEVTKAHEFLSQIYKEFHEYQEHMKMHISIQGADDEGMKQVERFNRKSKEFESYISMLEGRFAESGQKIQEYYDSQSYDAGNIFQADFSDVASNFSQRSMEIIGIPTNNSFMQAQPGETMRAEDKADDLVAIPDVPDPESFIKKPRTFMKKTEVREAERSKQFASYKPMETVKETAVNTLISNSPKFIRKMQTKFPDLEAGDDKNPFDLTPSEKSVTTIASLVPKDLTPPSTPKTKKSLTFKSKVLDTIGKKGYLAPPGSRIKEKDVRNFNSKLVSLRKKLEESVGERDKTGLRSLRSTVEQAVPRGYAKGLFAKLARQDTNQIKTIGGKTLFLDNANKSPVFQRYKSVFNDIQEALAQDF